MDPVNETDTSSAHENTAVRRRDFLYVAGGAMAAVGSLAAVWPFIDQMKPTTGALAAGGPLVVDLSPIQLGQQIVVRWRSNPVFIVHRTAPILAGLKESSLLSRLRDPQSKEVQQPPYVASWCRSTNPDYLVVIGICTHLGCIPTFMPQPGSVEAGWPGGYLCHCHGSKYDLAGRVFQGVPAPYNLPVPPYSFQNQTTLLIGQNPPGQTFDLSSVEQM
jgi:ubiquinol-cytochrome c reductase iron-sulfur subunit